MEERVEARKNTSLNEAGSGNSIYIAAWLNTADGQQYMARSPFHESLNIATRETCIAADSYQACIYFPHISLLCPENLARCCNIQPREQI